VKQALSLSQLRLVPKVGQWGQLKSFLEVDFNLLRFRGSLTYDAKAAMKDARVGM
jgi:hypothetical protein